MVGRPQLFKNMGEREKMIHARNDNVKGLQVGMNSEWPKAACGTGEE